MGQKFKLIVLLVFVSVLTSCYSSGMIKRTRPLSIQGHRGARARLPENTLAAMKYALDLGVDVLEADLGVTKDQVLVLSHDRHLNIELCLTKNGSRLNLAPPIRDLTLAEIKSFDCGSIKNRKFPLQSPIPGESIPTLDELFEMVKASRAPKANTVLFNLETKIVPDVNDTVPPETFVKLFLQTVKRQGMLERVVLQSFDFRTLRIAKKLEPKLKIAALTEERADYVAIAKDLSAEYISPHYTKINVDEIKALHEIGVKVAPWTVNSEWGWSKMIRADVDDIITDDPEALMEFIKRK
jgi:glycerophosphoryl diester phosphodiesterase